MPSEGWLNRNGATWNLNLFIKQDNVRTWSEAIYVTGRGYSIAVSPGSTAMRVIKLQQQPQLELIISVDSRLQLKCDGTRWCTGGEVKEKLMNWVYPALLPLMRTPRLPVVDWTDAPADLNGLVRFAERRNLVSARVPSHINWPPPQCLCDTAALCWKRLEWWRNFGLCPYTAARCEMTCFCCCNVWTKVEDERHSSSSVATHWTKE